MHNSKLAKPCTSPWTLLISILRVSIDLCGEAVGEAEEASKMHKMPDWFGY